MTRLATLLFAVLLMGGNCNGPDPDPDPDPRPEPNFYCAPAVLEAEPTLIESVSSTLAAIVGGEPSVDRRSTVFVRIGSSGYCTGTVINRRTVIMAAHCLGPSLTVEIKREGGIDAYPVAQAIGHPDYDTDPIQWYRGDIAVLVTESDLPEPYAPLYKGASQSAQCSDLVCQGHGTDLDSSTPTGLLQEVPCRVEQQFEFLLMTDGRKPNSGICFGDSGGPMYAMVGEVPHLAGVTSWTRDRDCLRGSGHISAWYYRDWIAQNQFQEAN